MQTRRRRTRRRWSAWMTRDRAAGRMRSRPWLSRMSVSGGHLRLMRVTGDRPSQMVSIASDQTLAGSSTCDRALISMHGGFDSMFDDTSEKVLPVAQRMRPHRLADRPEGRPVRPGSLSRSLYLLLVSGAQHLPQPPRAARLLHPQHQARGGNWQMVAYLQPATLRAPARTRTPKPYLRPGNSRPLQQRPFHQMDSLAHCPTPSLPLGPTECRPCSRPRALPRA